MRKIFGFALLFNCAFTMSVAAINDCNSNNVDDARDISGTKLTIRSLLGSRELLGERVDGFSSVGALLDFDLNGQLDTAFVVQKSNLGTSEISYALVLQQQSANGLTTIASPAVSFLPTKIGVGDYDSNGFTDVIISNGSQFEVAFNQGDNSFIVLPWVAVDDIDNVLQEQVSDTEQNVDLNDDDRLDLIHIKDDTTFEIMLRQEDNSLVSVAESTIDFDQDSGTLKTFAPVDVDNDGDLDVPLLATESFTQQIGTFNRSYVRFFENKGDGTFRLIKSSNKTAHYTYLGTQDATGDGVADLIFSVVYQNASSFPASTPRINRSTMAILQLRRNASSLNVNGNSLPDDCERAVPGDFGGDRISDATVVRDFAGGLTWFAHPSSSNQTANFQQNFGLSGVDLPYAGDFNGDGKVEPAVVRDAGLVIPSLYGLWWYSSISGGMAEVVQWGLSGDIAQVGYFDDDNKSDRAVVRSILGQLYWFIRLADGTALDPIPWGLQGDRVFNADRDGDGINELIVARNYLGGVYWFIRNLDGAYVETLQWGLTGDTPITPMDIGGDMKADMSIVRQNGSLLVFYTLQSESIPAAVSQFGLAGDVAYLGFFSGESSAIPAVFRPSTRPFEVTRHYQLGYDFGIKVQNFGLAGDYVVRADGIGVRP